MNVVSQANLAYERVHRWPQLRREIGIWLSAAHGVEEGSNETFNQLYRFVADGYPV